MKCICEPDHEDDCYYYADTVHDGQLANIFHDSIDEQTITGTATIMIVVKSILAFS